MFLIFENKLPVIRLFREFTSRTAAVEGFLFGAEIWPIFRKTLFRIVFSALNLSGVVLLPFNDIAVM